MQILSHSTYQEWSEYGVLDVENSPQHPSQSVHVDEGVQCLPHDVTLGELEEEGPIPDLNMQNPSRYAARLIQRCNHTK